MKLIYQIQQSVRNYLLRKSYYKLYKVIYHNNPLLKKKAVFEEKWLQKWKSLDSHIKIDSYRIFSRYVGEDINILPLEYCATVIEPFLNPKQFWAYYNDKNMFDKIFGTDILPKTIIRNISRNDIPVRILVAIRISNGLLLSRKNLSYQDLVRMVENLEGLC